MERADEDANKQVGGDPIPPADDDALNDQMAQLHVGENEDARAPQDAFAAVGNAMEVVANGLSILVSLEGLPEIAEMDPVQEGDPGQIPEGAPSLGTASGPIVHGATVAHRIQSGDEHTFVRRDDLRNLLDEMEHVDQNQAAEAGGPQQEGAQHNRTRSRSGTRECRKCRNHGSSKRARHRSCSRVKCPCDPCQRIEAENKRAAEYREQTPVQQNQAAEPADAQPQPEGSQHNRARRRSDHGGSHECRKCRNHGVSSNAKHSNCPHKKCKCDPCQRIDAEKNRAVTIRDEREEARALAADPTILRTVGDAVEVITVTGRRILVRIDGLRTLLDMEPVAGTSGLGQLPSNTVIGTPGPPVIHNGVRTIPILFDQGVVHVALTAVRAFLEARDR